MFTGMVEIAPTPLEEEIRGKSFFLRESASDSSSDGRFACNGHAIQPEYSLLAWIGASLHDLTKNINTVSKRQ